MDRDALVADVRLNIKRSSNGFSDAAIITRLDWAQEDIASVRTWKEMRKIYSFDLTASTSTYSYPTRCKEIYGIRVDDGGTGRRLKQWHPRKFDISTPIPSSVGEADPSYYIEYGADYYTIHPIPSNARTCYVYCSIMPATLSAGGDTPDLTNKDRLISARATEFCFQSIQEDELAAYWNAVAQGAYSAAVKMDQNRPDLIVAFRPYRKSVSKISGTPWADPEVGL